MRPISLEELDKMDEDQLLRALNLNKININDVDKAMLVLNKFENSRSIRPIVEVNCEIMENFIKSYKFQ